MSDICDLPLDRLSRLLRRGALSASEAVEAYLARIEGRDESLARGLRKKGELPDR